MSDQENFVARWSRRKREIAGEEAQPETPAVEQAGMPVAPGEVADQTAAAHAPGAEAPSGPEFDLNSLPSIESIGANSDIRPFLQAGVPSSLRHAALRRAWVADPAIRDFVGLAEYAWDFTDPDAVPGFGALDPNIDIKRLVAEVFGDDVPDTKLLSEAPVPVPQAEQPARLSENSAADAALDVPAAAKSATDGQHEVAAVADEKALLRCEENIAMQRDDLADEAAAARARRHGGAMPR